MNQCPACNYQLTMTEIQSGEEKCPSCGVYFHKWKAKAERAKREQAQISAAASEEQAANTPPVFEAAQPKATPTPGPSFRLAADPVKVATRGLGDVQPVVVVDIHMRFWSMVVFMVKAAMAAIPAVVILTGFVAIMFSSLASIFGA